MPRHVATASASCSIGRRSTRRVSRGAKDVSLTSRPSREAANRLYRRIGFEPRETNVYRYTF